MKANPSEEEIEKDERLNNMETRSQVLCKRMKVASEHRQTLILRLRAMGKQVLAHHSHIMVEIVDLLNTNTGNNESLVDKPFVSTLEILINTMEKVSELRNSNSDFIQYTQSFDALPSLIPMEGLLSHQERLMTQREESIEQQEAAYAKAEELLDSLR